MTLTVVSDDGLHNEVLLVCFLMQRPYRRFMTSDCSQQYFFGKYFTFSFIVELSIGLAQSVGWALHLKTIRSFHSNALFYSEH